MKTKILTTLIILAISVPAIYLLRKEKPGLLYNKELQEEEEREKEMRKEYSRERALYEFNLIKNPVTGKVPKNILERERAFARMLPVRARDPRFRETALNTYYSAGPDNVGGRTRALAYDIRYNGTTNRVIISGGVSSGIMRSADGGATWKRVSPQNDIHNVTAVAQDPRPGFQDTWYAGGGEPYGNSTANVALTSYLGHGIWKSTDNGVSWTKLSLTAITDIGGGVTGSALEAFDNPFDYVHKIAVNPVNGDLYIAAHRRLIRSQNGGSSFATVFAGPTAAAPENGQMDVTISTTGRIFLTVNGGFQDLNLRGVWVSNTGNQNSFSRIAGGQTLNVDSIPGWRGNAYTFFSGSTYNSKRILISLAPSNQNVAYVLYENGLLSENGQPEGDLFRLDINGNSFTWTNRSANMPDFPGGNLTGVDPYSVQEGYDMCITVKPDNPNFVILGGTNLYRSTDGFASSNVAWIGGYSPTAVTTQNPVNYPNSHPDMHIFVFNPSNFNEGISGDDGGLHRTADITASSVGWAVIPNYQTIQYYYVAIDPTTNRNNFAGGAQDNGTTIRDKTGIFSTPATDSNNHRILAGGGDGNSVGISALNGSSQFIYYGIQGGRLRRATLPNLSSSVEIRPSGLTTTTPSTTSDFGEFVTNFKLNPDNTEDLYYVNFNRFFRTTSASTVSSSSGWTELTGVSSAVNPTNSTGGRNIRIRAIAFTRGAYTSSHALYIGTTPDVDVNNGRQGKIFRIDDPRNFNPSAAPVDITPPGLQGNVQNIAVNPENDNEIIAVVSNYDVVSIWWTNNAKAASPNWRNAEGNLTLPSIRSCAIVVKKDANDNPVTEYYVGTSVGLYSTVGLNNIFSNGGSPVWQREGEDILNFAVVQSLAYRPADNVMLIGTHGNGMYYTYLGGGGTTPPPANNVFIVSATPTLTNSRVNYEAGNLQGVTKILVNLYSSTGQLLYKEEADYRSGYINLYRFAAGMYILQITSSDGKQKFVQKLIKQ